MSVEWFDYPSKTPPAKGEYLIANNNWKAKNLKGDPVLSFSVSIGFFNGMGYWLGCDGHLRIEPDQWAFIPEPEKAPRPKEEGPINYQI